MKLSLKLKIAGAATAVGLLYAGGQALAANITYSSDVTVDFSSPDVNFTIVSGSTATEVVVNAGSIVVTIPTSSGFTVTSASRDISFTGGSSESTRSLTCSGGTATLTVTAGSNTGEVITMSPATSQCGVNAGGGGGGGGSGGGGGGGGGSPSPAPAPAPSPAPAPTSSLSAPPPGAHPNGTLILDGKTVYVIKNGKKYGFRNPDEYKSHGYNFNQAVSASAVDKTLPLEAASVVKALEGTLVLDASDSKTVYMIGSGSTKRGFASATVFKALGYSFSNLPKINLSDYPSGPAITSSGDPHPEGALVRQSNGTVWWILAGKRQGFESLAVFNTYGFPTTRLVKSNDADMALPQGALVKFRDGTLVKDGSNYYLISDGKKMAFSSSAVLSAKGYKAANAISASLSAYQAGGNVE